MGQASSVGVVKKKKFLTKNKAIALLAVVVVAIVALTTVFVLQRSRASVDVVEGAASSEIQDRVASLAIIPNEEAYVATLTDRSQVEEQAFYADAQNGDRVLLFKKAKKAIIYRESENKIVNIGPILVSDEELDTWNIDTNANIGGETK